MIIDHRIYLTACAIAALMWIGALYPINRGKPGEGDFYVWMRRADILMWSAAALFVLTGFVGFLDWLWA